MTRRNVATEKDALSLRFKRSLQQHWMYYLMFAPCVILLGIFCYAPMYGIIVAFKDYYPKIGFVRSPFASPLFKHFTETFSSAGFLDVTFNTLRISILRLLIGFPAPIILALMFNEVRHSGYKRTVQAIAYLPHFLSWVVLGGMFKILLSGDGIINSALGTLGVNSVPFLTDAGVFIGTLIVTGIWKGIGFATIIYMAAIAGIDQEQYEAATIDGATRWQKNRYITIPGMSIAISITLILSLSGILDGGFDQIFNMYSPQVYKTADIIDTFVYRNGIVAGNFEMGTAIGLSKSLIALLLIMGSNKLIKRFGGEGIW